MKKEESSSLIYHVVDKGNSKNSFKDKKCVLENNSGSKTVKMSISNLLAKTKCLKE